MLFQMASGMGSWVSKNLNILINKGSVKSYWVITGRSSSKNSTLSNG